MLLNNLTKSSQIINILLPKNQATTQTRTKHLDNLLEVFVRGVDKEFNPNANFHFLSGVFANVSATPSGAEFLLGKSTVDSSRRLSRLVVFIEHENLVRRGGVISVLKNVCFNKEHHQNLLEDLGLLPFILLPLAGPEEYDEEV